VSFLTQLPISADQDRAISFTLKQAMRIMLNRDLLNLSAPDAVENSRENTGKHTVFAAIVPHRLQDVEASQADNPFASASIIADKNARRLYSVVDGHKNIVELSQMAHLDQKDLIEALRYLFQLQKIEFYTLDGELVRQVSFLLPSS
jgi:hypothetical protein